MTEERVAIFIDGANLYHCLRDEFGKHHIDMEKLPAKLCGDRKLIRTHYYIAAVDGVRHPEEQKDQQRFLDRLSFISYFEVHLGHLEPRGQSRVEKGVDVRLAVDMVTGAYQDTYDTAILISGDADFAYAVQAVKDRGKHVENAFIQTGQSRLLRQTCDRSILLDRSFLQDVWLP